MLPYYPLLRGLYYLKQAVSLACTKRYFRSYQLGIDRRTIGHSHTQTSRNQPPYEGFIFALFEVIL